MIFSSIRVSVDQACAAKIKGGLRRLTAASGRGRRYLHRPLTSSDVLFHIRRFIPARAGNMPSNVSQFSRQTCFNPRPAKWPGDTPAYPEDVKAVAKTMGISPEGIEKLKPLQWMEKDMATGKMSSGVLTF
jgi:hypothetical protein